MYQTFITYKNIFLSAPLHKLLNYLLAPPLYVFSGIYFGVRVWQAFGAWLAFPPYLIACCLLFLLGPATFLCFGLPGYSPLRKWLSIIGSLWAVSLLYGFAASCFLELIRLIDSYTGNTIAAALREFTGLPAITLSACLVLAFLLFFFIKGIYNAVVPQIHKYSVKVPHISEALTLVLLSDAHLVNLTSPVRLDRLCHRVGRINADAVLLAGDIVDNRLELVKKQKIAERLAAIQTKHGVFFAPGNHEYIQAAKGSREKTGSAASPAFQDRVGLLLSYFREAGIHVLSDEKATLGGLCTIAGRRDIDIQKHTDSHRNSLSQVLFGADPTIPVIVLDHQTEYYKEAQEAGADLLLSGHTHKGQVFPLTAFSRRRYAHNYGLYRDENLTHIVSSGCGSWGPPIRFGSRAEIVLITLYS